MAANTLSTGSFVDLGGVPAQTQQAIGEAVQQGLLHGDPNGAFRPTSSLTREELAVVIQEALQLPLSKGRTSFSDVDPNGWASSAIEAVRSAGIMQGDGNGLFRPTELLSRQELAVLLARASQQPLVQPRDPDAPVSDWSGVSSWAQPYVRTLLALGTMKAEGGKFAPAASLQRQEVAEMLLQTFFPKERLSTLGAVEADRVWINGVPYQLSEGVKGLLNPQNAKVLQGATLKFESTGRKLDKLTALELHANGAAAGSGQQEFSGNLVLDGQGATLDGGLSLAGDYLSVQNLTVKGDFKIGSQLANDFSARNLSVEGTTFVQGGDRNTVVFEDSQLGNVDVSKQNVRVEATGTTSVDQMTLSSDAAIVGSATANVGQVTLADGASQVEVQGTLGTLVMSGSQPVTLTGNANIGTVSVQTAAPVTLNNSGTVGKLQVLDAGSKVQVGQGLTVSSVALGAGVSANSISGLSTPTGSGTTNTAPVLLSAIPDQVVTLGGTNLPFDLAPYFHDEEQSVLHYIVASTGPSTCKVSVDANGVVTFTPLKQGKAKITVAVDDFNSQKVNTSFYVTVNLPPTSAAISDQTATVGSGPTTVDLNALFSDPDNDTLTYEASVADTSVATSGLASGQLSLNPVAAGTTTVTVKAKDGRGGELEKTFQLTVNPAPPAPNQKPVVSSAPSNQTVTVGAADYTLDLSTIFTDPDGDALTFTATSSDASVATVTAVGSQLTLHQLAVGTSTITLTATDSHGEAETATFVVTVNPAPPAPNQKPMVSSAPSNQTVTVGAADYTLDLSTVFTDPDGDVLTFDASSSDAGVATATAVGSQLTLHPLTAGTATITLTATDSLGAAESTTFNVTVLAATPNPSQNQAPEVVATIYTQVLTPTVTNDRSYDLAQLFSDADGDTLTFTAVSNSAQAATASVSGNMLTLSPGSGTGSTTVTVTASDGKGGTATYDVNVITAPLVTNGRVTIHTKQGVKENINYDLSTLFPNQTSFKIYEGTPDSTFTGPTPLNGTVWTTPGTTSPLTTWVVAADGTAAVFNVVADPQGASELYFSQYLDAGDGRIAIEMFYNGNGSPGDMATGYSVDVYRYMKNTNTMSVVNVPLHDAYPTMPYILIDSIFYDFFDIINAWYYNDEVDAYNPNTFNFTGLVLKQGTRVVDVLGDPNSHNQFMPNGGTIIRKSGIRTGSQSFSQAGEYNTFPKGTLQFFGQHTM
nr:S-layer homology domain-containing protein [Tumebacillus amylolyticus]